MSIVFDTLIAYLPGNRKVTPSGWTSFNAICCIHNGESVDTKKRGGVIEVDDTVSYHCFNCGFKASWSAGRTLSRRMRQLFEWLGVPDDTISRISLELLRAKEGVESKERIVVAPKFEVKELPPDTISIADWDGGENKYITKLANYMHERGLTLDDCNFMWSPDRKFRNRLIIPFYFEGKCVGWTARDTTGATDFRYISEQQPGYVFGLDAQADHQRPFVIVVEGPIDAIHIDGVSLLGSELKAEQALLINTLGKDVILVPDRDSNGQHMVEAALEQGWAVSFPPWEEDIGDTGEAVARYGKLYTLHSIITNAEYSQLKIKLRKKKWFKTMSAKG